MGPILFAISLLVISNKNRLDSTSYMLSNVQNSQHIQGLGNLQLLRAHKIHAPIPPKVNKVISDKPQTMNLKMKDKTNTSGHLENPSSDEYEAPYCFKKIGSSQEI